MRFLIATAVAVSALLTSGAAEAQLVVTYAVPHVVHYAPAPYYASPYVVRTVATGRPVFVSPAAYGFGPGARIAPAYINPATVVTRTVVAHPVVTTRYRPILGGTVTRARYRYAPANVVITPY